GEGIGLEAGVWAREASRRQAPDLPLGASGVGGEVMSRQIYFLGVGLALVALAFVVTDEFDPGAPGITERNAKRIRRGMTAGEVEALLGLQSGTGGCVAGPGFFPWWQVKGILTYLEDPTRRQ